MNNIKKEIFIKILKCYLISKKLNSKYYWAILDIDIKKSNNIAISWTWGKDSYYVLHSALKSWFEVKYLFVITDQEEKMSITWPYNLSLLREQAKSLWIEIICLKLKWDVFSSFDFFFKFLSIKNIKNVGFWYFIPGQQRDFVQQIAYKNGIAVFEPNLWISQETRLLDIINLWIKAIIVWINKENINHLYLWKELNLDFYKYLKTKRLYNQFCWENWDFQTFVVDSPLFKFPLNIKKKYQFKLWFYVFNYYDI